jgi:hypothetical protein
MLSVVTEKGWRSSRPTAMTIFDDGPEAKQVQARPIRALSNESILAYGEALLIELFLSILTRYKDGALFERIGADRFSGLNVHGSESSDFRLAIIHANDFQQHPIVSSRHTRSPYLIYVLSYFFDRSWTRVCVCYGVREPQGSLDIRLCTSLSRVTCVFGYQPSPPPLSTLDPLVQYSCKGYVMYLG